MSNQEETRLDPAVLLAPVPVAMVSCQDAAADAAPNIITVAWVGVACSDPPMLSVAVRPERFSYDLIAHSREFVVNLVDQDLVEACDFCGVRSGRTVDKFKACGLTAAPADQMIYAPAIQESPLSISCRLEQVVPLGSHHLLLGRVVAVRSPARWMDASGRLRLDRARLVTYVHGEYFLVGKRLGFFGYSVARPNVLAKRMPGYRRKRAFE